MKLLITGVSHKTAPVEVRECLAFREETLPAALADLSARDGVEEAVILSTCNRVEIAVTTADGTRAISKEYLDVGKMFGARTRNVWFGIALPSATPFIVAGIELGFARGITNAIAVEILASVNGMGMSVFTKSNELNENASLVYVLFLAIFAVGIRTLMIRFRHWLAPWYHR